MKTAFQFLQMIGFLLVLTTGKSQPISVGFANAFGTTGQNTGYDVESALNGETITVGSYTGAFSFGTIPMASQGGTEGFVVKSDPNGNYLWAKALSSTGNDLISKVSLDALGNVYIVGEHESTATFDGNTLTNNEGKNAFVAKLNPDGNVVWQRSIGNELDAKFTSLNLDGNGNVYAYGDFNGTLNLDASVLTSVDEKNLFLVKLSNVGVVAWAKSFGKKFDNSSDVWVNPIGESFLTGGFLGRLILGTDTLFSNGLSDVFVARLDVNGNFIWARSIGGSQTDNCFSIVGDSDNNVYFSAVYMGSLTLGGNSYESNGQWDVLTAKYSSNGVPLWSTSFGGSANDRANEVQLDASGNLLVTGWFQDTMQVGPSNLISKGNFDVFVATISSSGVPLLCHSFGGTSQDVGAGIGIDGTGNLYLTGNFFSTDFVVGTVSVPNPIGTKVFLIKLGSSSTSIQQEWVSGSLINQRTFDNYVELESLQDGDLLVSNLKGQIIYQGPLRSKTPIRIPRGKEILFYAFGVGNQNPQVGKIAGF